MEIQVLDEATGKPVSGVAVMSPYNVKPGSDPASLEASLPRTDEKGKIQINIPPVLIPPGLFYLALQSSNHPPRNLNWSSPGGASIRDLLPASYTIRLAAQKTVGGVVHNAQGQPVAGAKVIVSGYDQAGVNSSTAGLQFFDQAGLPRETKRGVATDTAGRWQFDRYPLSIRYLNLDVVAPSGAITSFMTPQPDNYSGHRQRDPDRSRCSPCHQRNAKT